MCHRACGQLLEDIEQTSEEEHVEEEKVKVNVET